MTAINKHSEKKGAVVEIMFRLSSQAAMTNESKAIRRRKMRIFLPIRRDAVSDSFPENTKDMIPNTQPK